MLVDGDFFIPTSPCDTEPFTLRMFVKPPGSRNENALSFLEHSKLILNFILVGFLIATLFIFAFQLFDQWPNRTLTVKSKIQSKVQSKVQSKIHTKVRLNVFYRSFRALVSYYESRAKRSYTPSKVNCIMLTFLMFLTILNNMLTFNINTNRVILNTSELINTKAKLESTKRWACWFEVDSAANDLLVKNSQTIDLTRILARKLMSPGRVCIVNITPQNSFLFEMPISELFLVALKSSLHIFLSYFYPIVDNRYNSRLTFFENDQLMNFELIRVQYVATELESHLKARLLLK